MAKGFIRGALVGVVVSAAGLGMLSELVPIPRPPADAAAPKSTRTDSAKTEAPASQDSSPAQTAESQARAPSGGAASGTGSKVDSTGAGTQAGASSQIEAPDGAGGGEGSGTGPAPTRPAPKAGTAAPAPATAGKETGSAAGATSGGTPSQSPPLAAPETAPAAPGADAAPAHPANPPAASSDSASGTIGTPEVTIPGERATQPQPIPVLPKVVDTLPSAPGAPKPGFNRTVPGVTVNRLPTVGDTAEPPTARPGQGDAGGLRPAPAPVPAPGAPDAPDAPDGAAPAPRFTKVPQPGDTAAPDAVSPWTGGPDSTSPGTSPETTTPAAPAPAASSALPADAPALQRYAAPFSNPQGRPIFSIILIDTGGHAVDRVALTDLGLPITFAIDPAKPNAAAAAQLYRDAGREVLILAKGIPSDAGASDVAARIEGFTQAVPQAVGLLDPASGGFETDRPLSKLIVGRMAEQGLGLVTYGQGLDAAAQIARSEGLPSARVYRRLDAGGESVAKITRYLDRAAFRAAQEGRVVVIGHTTPATITALSEWAGTPRAHTVAPAPVSAALKP